MKANESSARRGGGQRRSTWNVVTISSIYGVPRGTSIAFADHKELGALIFAKTLDPEGLERRRQQRGRIAGGAEVKKSAPWADERLQRGEHARLHSDGPHRQRVERLVK